MPKSKREIQCLNMKAKKDHVFVFVDGGADLFVSNRKQCLKKFQTILAPRKVAKSEIKRRSILWVGDADSLSEIKLKAFSKCFEPEITRLSSVKDLADTACALNLISARFKSKAISFIGFEGGLLDHELAFIADVFIFLKSFKTAKCEWIRRDSSVFFLNDRSTKELRTSLNQSVRVSIVPHSDFIQIKKMIGYEYVANKIRRSSHAISNTTNALHQIISLKTGEALVFSYA